MTHTRRVLDFVEQYSGLTAWQITKALWPNDAHRMKGTISSLVYRLAEEKGSLKRVKNKKGSWTYYLGQ